MEEQILNRLRKIESLPEKQKQYLKAYLSINEAKHIMQKNAQCPRRPVPVQFARQLRKSALNPPPYAFRNWAKMAEWYKNT